MKIIAVILVSLSVLAISQAQVRTYVKTSFDGKTAGTIPPNYTKSIYLFPKKNGLKEQAYFIAVTYPKGSSRKRLKVNFVSHRTYGEKGKALSFAATNGEETNLCCSGINEDNNKLLSVKKDLWISFCIYVESPGNYYLSIWNRSKKKNRKFKLNIKAKKWEVIKMNLYAPPFLEIGDKISSISIYNRENSERNWIIDNWVIWHGKDNSCPTVVNKVFVKNTEQGNILSWNASDNNLFIEKYKIYRGTVKNFLPQKNNQIGETMKTNFCDNKFIWQDSYYKVIAQDISGNLSKPSVAVKPY